MNKIGPNKGDGIEVAATDSKWQASISITRMSRKGAELFASWR